MKLMLLLHLLRKKIAKMDGLPIILDEKLILHVLLVTKLHIDMKTVLDIEANYVIDLDIGLLIVLTSRGNNLLVRNVNKPHICSKTVQKINATNVMNMVTLESTALLHN